MDNMHHSLISVACLLKKADGLYLIVAAWDFELTWQRKLCCELYCSHVEGKELWLTWDCAGPLYLRVHVKDLCFVFMFCVTFPLSPALDACTYSQKRLFAEM